MLKVVLYQCPKCGLGENGNEFMHKRRWIRSFGEEERRMLLMFENMAKGKGEEIDFLIPVSGDFERIQFRCRACGYRWEVPCE